MMCIQDPVADGYFPGGPATDLDGHVVPESIHAASPHMSTSRILSLRIPVFQVTFRARSC